MPKLWDADFFFSVNSYQTGLDAWLPACSKTMTPAPMWSAQTASINMSRNSSKSGPRYEVSVSSSSLLIGSFRADLRSPAVWLAGTEVNGKCTPSVLPSFLWSCSAEWWDCMCVYVCCVVLVCTYVTYYSHQCLSLRLHLWFRSVCLCLRDGLPDLLYSMM